MVFTFFSTERTKAELWSQSIRIFSASDRSVIFSPEAVKPPQVISGT